MVDSYEIRSASGRRASASKRATTWSYPSLSPPSQELSSFSAGSRGPVERSSTSLTCQEYVRSRQPRRRHQTSSSSGTKSPFMQALRITTEVIRTSPPGTSGSGAASPVPRSMFPPLSPSLARRSRVHFWSNLFKPQQDTAQGQPKSNSGRSSCGGDSGLQHCSSNKSFPHSRRTTCEGSSVSPVLQHSRSSKSFEDQSRRITCEGSSGSRQLQHSKSRNSSSKSRRSSCEDSPGSRQFPHSKSSKSFSTALNSSMRTMSRCSSSKSSPATEQLRDRCTSESPLGGSPRVDWPSNDEEIAEELLAACSYPIECEVQSHEEPCGGLPRADWPSNEDIAEELLAANSFRDGCAAQHADASCSAPLSTARSFCFSLRDTSIAAPCISVPTSGYKLPPITSHDSNSLDGHRFQFAQDGLGPETVFVGSADCCDSTSSLATVRLAGGPAGRSSRS